MKRAQRSNKMVMKINIWFLSVAVLGLVTAACAPDPAWSDAWDCPSLSCGTPEAPCQASVARLSLRLDQEIFDAGPELPSVALVPLALGKGEARCVADLGCAEKERCLEGRCWRALASSAQLRRWRSGQGPLAHSLPGWWARKEAGSTLALQSTLGSERGGIWAMYLGPRWVSAKGQPLHLGLEPAALISVQGHGAGPWSEQRPVLVKQGKGVEIALPKGWSLDAPYQWSLSCGPGLGVAISPLPSCPGKAPCVAFAFTKALDVQGRSCRLLVKIPGQAALPTGWIGPADARVSSQVLPDAGLVYGGQAW